MNKLYIANIVRDDKFIDNVIQFHDLTSDRCCHDYILVKDSKKEYKRINKVNRIKVIPQDQIISYIDSQHYNAVFLHSLVSMPYKLIPHIKKSIPVFWFAWGFDIYNLLIRMPLLHQYSLRYYLRFFWKERLLHTLSHVLLSVSTLKSFGKLYNDAVGRIDYFSGVLPIEYELCQSRSFRAKRVEYYYCDVNMLKSWGTNENMGKNIIIGNSCDINNNHLDLLPYLHSIDFKDKKIIVPLSYGGNKIYQNKVRKEFSKLGENSTIIDRYMPLKEYLKLLTSANVGIFFHERQQAMGNIEFLILNGGKLFLSKTSVIFNYLKSQGFYIYSIQDDLNTISIHTELNDAQKQHNKALWMNSHSLDAEIEKLDNLYKIVVQSKS